MSTKIETRDPTVATDSQHAQPSIDMHSACNEDRAMSGTIQIRNVPVDVHRRLKANAALEGLSLSDYMLREAKRLASYPTTGEIRARLSALPKHDLLDPSPEHLIREDRDSR